MRTNLPITGIEIELADDATLVSYTNPKGIILRVNDEFLRVSKFAESELVGQPHNKASRSLIESVELAYAATREGRPEGMRIKTGVVTKRGWSRELNPLWRLWTIRDVVDSVNPVATLVAEISHASQEQSTGIDLINQMVMQIDDGTQRNAALVEDAAASARSLEQQSGHLVQTAAAFRLGSESEPRSFNTSFTEPTPLRSRARAHAPAPATGRVIQHAAS